jgi:hypothetical protein
MDQRVDIKVGDCVANEILIRYLAFHEFGIGDNMRAHPRRAIVEHDDLVTTCQQPQENMTADVTCAASKHSAGRD